MSASKQAIQQDSTPEMLVTGVRVPAEIWIAVKMMAAAQRTSAQQITIDALTDYLAKQNDKAA